MNTHEVTEEKKKVNQERIKTIKSIIFAALIVLVMPLLIPLLLKGFYAIVQTEFALAMYNVAKAWTFITQIIAIFITIKYNMRYAYAFIFCAPLLLFVLEVIIYLLGLMPIW